MDTDVMNGSAPFGDYLATRSPDAFARIVERYGPVVYWSGYEPSSNSPDEVHLAHDPANVLKHIAEQTGLTLSEETHSVRRLIVTTE